MRKVVCPQCGLVNLDRFVTFPHCAGCGVRLPDKQPGDARAFWRRPMRAPFWASIIALGCAAMAAVAIGIIRETSHPDYGQLVVYAQVPRNVAPENIVVLQFHLDTTDQRAPATFREVRFRLPRPIVENFEISSVAPEPDESFRTGGGSYYQFEEISREEAICVTLRPKRTGTYRFNAQIYAQDYQPFECHNYVTVHPDPVPATLKKVPGEIHAH